MAGGASRGDRYHDVQAHPIRCEFLRHRYAAVLPAESRQLYSAKPIGSSH
jgi:hypothetical protein